MKKTAVLCGAAALALLLGGCGAPDTRDADAKALRDNETQWNQDFAAKDADKLAAHYADDAVLMSPGMPAATGKDNIRKVLKDMVSDPALSLKFQAAKVDVAKSGDLAYAEGSYTMTMTEPASKRIVNDRGSYVTAYRKQADGSWKAVADIATSETPMAAPPAPARAIGKKAKHKKRRR